MKVLHINSYFSTSGLFKNLYDRQVSQGLDIEVYVPIPYDYPAERLAASGDYTFVDRNHPRISRYIFHWKHYLILNQLNKHYELPSYDLVHAHSLFSNGWLAWRIFKKYRVPYVVAVRNTDIRTFFEKMPWLRSTGLRILSDASEIILISQNSYDELFEKYIPKRLQKEIQSKTRVLTNGIDDFWHNHQPAQPHTQVHQPLRIVTTGKVSAIKRFEHLAKTLDIYQENVGPVELHVIGPNWDDQILTRLEKHPFVHYHGAKTMPEIANIYRQMDIFALVSHPETFGLVYPEAMSQGLPVIYTKNEGFDSFFENYYIGVSVQREDPQELMVAIDHIVDHYEELVERTQKNCRFFNWDDIAQKYLTIYQEILKEK